MRLHSITLTDFKGVERRRVEFAEQGVTLVIGRNEIGKTSLVEALDLLVDEKSTSKKQAIKDAQPTHRDAGPEVEAELSIGPYRLRYRKRWLKSPLCELHITEPKPEQVTGEQAHERFGAILDEQAVDRLLWRQLRIDQAGLVVQARVGDRPAIARALGTRGSAAPQDGPAESGQSTGDGPEARIYDLAGQELRRYLTRERREPTGELRAAREAQADARAGKEKAEKVLADAQAAIDEFAFTGRLITDNTETLKQARTDLVELERQEKQLAQEQEQRRALELQIGDHERKDSAARKVADLERDLDALTGDAKVARESATAAGQAHLAATAEAAKLHAGLDAARIAAREAAAELRYRVDLDQEAALAARLERARTSSDRAAAVAAELSRVTITEPLLDQVEAAHNAWELAKASLDASAPTISVTRLGAGAVLIDGSRWDAEDVDDARLAVTEPVTVEAPGLLRVVVSPGADEHNRRDRLTEAAAGYRDLCAQAEVADVAEARAADRTRRRLLEEQRDAERELEAALAGDTHTVVSRQSAVLRDRIAEHLRERGALKGTGERAEATEPAEAAEGAEGAEGIEQLEGREAAARATAESTEALARAADAAVRDLAEAANNARVGQALLDGRLESARAELDRARVDLAALPEPVDGERLGDLKALLAASTNRIADCQPDLLALKLKNTRALIEQTAEEQHDLQARQTGAQVRMAMLGDGGPAETLERAAADLERATHDLTLVQNRADAARLLFDTLDQHRLEARRGYAAPLRQRIEHYAGMVFGPGVRVEISDELTVASKTIGGVTVPFEQLSAGAREQLALIGRIACAELIAPGAAPDGGWPGGGPTDSDPSAGGSRGGVPLIIDDALGHSDRDRLEALAAILGTAAEQLQVIVLTSAPERFKIGAAQRIALA